jgi:hypothetical protein
VFDALFLNGVEPRDSVDTTPENRLLELKFRAVSTKFEVVEDLRGCLGLNARCDLKPGILSMCTTECWRFQSLDALKTLYRRVGVPHEKCSSRHGIRMTPSFVEVPVPETACPCSTMGIWLMRWASPCCLFEDEAQGPS